jgi:hypothetical protein
MGGHIFKKWVGEGAVLDSSISGSRQVMDKVASGSMKCKEFCFRCQYHSTNAPFSSSYARCPYQKSKRAKLGNLSEIGEHCIEKHFHFFHL